MLPYCLILLFRSNNLERLLFSSREQSECETFCKMAGVNSFNRGETLDVFLGMLDESELFHLFKEEMDFFFLFFSI